LTRDRIGDLSKEGDVVFVESPSNVRADFGNFTVSSSKENVKFATNALEGNQANGNLRYVGEQQGV
jgi:hypothetical protein